jgi:hypothetical protein
LYCLSWKSQLITNAVQRDDFAGFEPFIELPDRSLKDYYAIIPNPLSLVGLQKKVKGIRGKAAATGVSDFKNWAAFEEEASLIWRNAYHYNEDGSDIFVLARELQVNRFLLNKCACITDAF